MRGRKHSLIGSIQKAFVPSTYLKKEEPNEAKPLRSKHHLRPAEPRPRSVSSMERPQKARKETKDGAAAGCGSVISESSPTPIHYAFPITQRSACLGWGHVPTPLQSALRGKEAHGRGTPRERERERERECLGGLGSGCGLGITQPQEQLRSPLKSLNERSAIRDSRERNEPPQGSITLEKLRAKST